MDKHIDFSELIVKYLDNEMSDSERIWFEKELDGNQTLQKELKLYQDIYSATSKEDTIAFKEKLLQAQENFDARKSKKQNSKTKRILITGSAAACIAALLIYALNYNFSSQKLFEQHYQVANISNTLRSSETSDNNALNNAIAHYKNSEYQHAADIFDPIINKEPNSFGLLFYAGIAHMETGDIQKAKNYFQQIIINGKNPFVQKAHWYIAMCYLSLDDRDQAMHYLRYLVEEETDYSKKAKSVLRRL